MFLKSRYTSVANPHSHHSGCQMTSTTRQKGYLPWRLQWWTITLFTVVHIAFITIIITLLVESKSKSGFATVPSRSAVQVSPFGLELGKVSKDWAYSLLWTSLPTLIVTIYVLCWSTIISDLEDRQPFIELANPAGVLGKVSVLLDYRQNFAGTRWYRALRNKHQVLGIAILLMFAHKLALIALASHLFVADDSLQTRPLDMLLTTAFNESAVNSRTNIASALNLVLATRNLDARFPPWTLDRYAFPQFSPATKANLGTALAVNLTAYSADLDCLSISDYSISSTSDSTGKAVTVSGTDRNCAFHTQLFVDSGGATEYVTTFAVANCGGSSRLALVSGYYDANAANSLSDTNVISCIPSYWQTPGDLSISAAEPPQSPSILGFKPSGFSTSFQWSSSAVFETGVHLASPLDPTATISSTTFGLQVLAFTRKTDPTLRPSSAALMNATIEIFQSTFAFTAKSFILQTTANSVTVAGTVSTNISRLFVVTWIAGLMIALLLLVMIWTIVIGIQSHRATSILKEQPKGLLGLALLLPPPNPTLHDSAYLNSASLGPASTYTPPELASQMGYCTWLVSQFWANGGYSQGLSFEDISDANGVKEKMFVAPLDSDGKRVITETPVETREYKMMRGSLQA